MESLGGPRLRASPPANIESHSPPKKRPRKSRSRGLRARTGCIICRQRHKKCDEASPRCTNCSIANRACIWPRQATQLETTPDALSPGQGADSGIIQGSPNYLQESLDLLPEEPRGHPNPPDSDSIIQTCAYSPSNTVTSDCLPADLASVRWLDLLATDAIQANRGFSRAPSPVQGPAGNTDLGGSSNYPSRSGPILSINDQNIGNERFSWRLDQDIVLKDFEIAIFRNFINRAALWLDVFDPDMHFSTYATRLALRNVGLMKAIIALSAQHLSRQTQSQDGSNTIADPNLAVQYYYETLHYVQTALQYNSYAHSEVILATALVISTYEMLDESDSGWQRHLKGVFWIQRSQNVNGASGGIRQAVWWAWLRQDVWAAFREKRRCLSFWKPVKVYSELNQHELLDRATYLLSQVVNYCADRNESSGLGREGAADELFEMLDHWKSFLDESFKPLPTVGTNGTFQPIWIHPPKFGAALQIFYFARILLILHRPALPGFRSHLKAQKLLAYAVRMICGIAMELKDEGCQISSSQCLYGAGLCVHDSSERGQIISLIDACEARTGWPMSTLREDLRKEWQKVDSDDQGQDERSII